MLGGRRSVRGPWCSRAPRARAPTPGSSRRICGIPGLDPEREAVDAVGVATVIVEAIGLAFALRLMHPPGRHGRSTQLKEVTR
jgi:hypothetical protein